MKEFNFNDWMEHYQAFDADKLQEQGNLFSTASDMADLWYQLEDEAKFLEENLEAAKEIYRKFAAPLAKQGEPLFVLGEEGRPYDTFLFEVGLELFSDEQLAEMYSHQTKLSKQFVSHSIIRLFPLIEFEQDRRAGMAPKDKEAYVSFWRVFYVLCRIKEVEKENLFNAVVGFGSLSLSEKSVEELGVVAHVHLHWVVMKRLNDMGISSHCLQYEKNLGRMAEFEKYVEEKTAEILSQVSEERLSFFKEHLQDSMPYAEKLFGMIEAEENSRKK